MHRSGTLPRLTLALTLTAGLAAIAPVAVATTTAHHTTIDRPNPTVETLINRPDLRPARVAATRDFNFGGGESIKKGTELRVHELTQSAIVLDTGAFIFEAKAEDTDLLERAKALIDALSDEALALTLTNLAAQHELWPTSIALTSDYNFADGKRIPAGDPLALRSFKGNTLQLHHAPTDILFTAPPADTDLLTRARANTAIPKADRRPFFVRSLEDALQPKASRPKAIPANKPFLPEPVLKNAEYILVYQGRKECTRCARFTPDLLRTYDKLKREHDNFEVVFLAQDRSAALHDQHVREKNMPWKVLPYDKRFATPATDLQSQMLPTVYLVRPDGTVIDNVAPDGRGRSAQDVLKTLERELR